MNIALFLILFVLQVNAVLEIEQIFTYGEHPPLTTAKIIGHYKNKLFAVFPNNPNLFSLDLL